MLHIALLQENADTEYGVDDIGVGEDGDASDGAAADGLSFKTRAA